MLFRSPGELLHAVEGRLRHLVARAFGVLVERADDLETFLLETAVAEQRGAEVADTDEHDRLEPVRDCETRVDVERDSAAIVPAVFCSSIVTGDSPWPMTWSMASARLPAGTVPVSRLPLRSIAV